ncbi:glycoside hydrolase family 35 protein [Sphaerobolus stellatus SS14]|nr:glycoside hydrolase family 35 protein [Sphaerobolus stellatus SS14]
MFSTTTILHYGLLFLALFTTRTCGHLDKRNSTGLTDAITWDPHSLSIFGQRVFILSAEVHPWRQPNPNLWQDIFQKIKANGFNTVSFYVNWALHYPTPDSAPDFQPGTYRDLQRFIDEAHAAGLWMIARPGPYINGETTGGGFPGWVGNIAGSLRTNNANYTQAWQPYMNAVSQIIARNQVTNGGPIILVQAENEFSVGSTHNPYMQAIINTYRANGIVVPITFNDQHSGQAGNFSPDLGGEGAVNIYCGDSYPQGANSWAQVQAIYYSDHVAVAPSNPLCLAEFGGGFLLSWGSATRGGTGYEKYIVNLTNADYENVFYKENYAQTATILNIYMLYGGTNWGQTLEPTVYSSYDYGGGINENRVLTPKMPEMRLQGLFLRVSRELLSANLIANGTNYTTNSIIHTAELRNPETNAGFYFIRHNSSPSTSIDSTQLNISTSVGQILIPQVGNITLNGRESKIIVTDYVFGNSNTVLLYSTAEIMTWTVIDKTDHIILYAPKGQNGESVFLLANEPTVSFNGATNVQSTWSNGTLRLNYSLLGSSVVDIQVGKTRIRVIILEKGIANSWHAPLINGNGTFANFYSIGTNETVLVAGPYLIRDAQISGAVLKLNGDVNQTTNVEVLASTGIKAVIWNGANQRVSKTPYGSSIFVATGPNSIKLPALGSWKVLNSLPEVETSFDDSAFVTANLTTTNYTNLPPLSGDRVLYSQQYGFYGGNLIFRGHFNASGTETAFNLTVQGGFAFGYSAFLNGVFLGSNQGTPTVSLTTDVWPIPNNTLVVGEDNVLTVFQDHMGIVETSTNSGKEPRGIRGYAILGGNTTFTTWKLQGNLGGGSNNPDKFRGYLNEGGLYAERIGAHLPEFDDSLWEDGDPLEGIKSPGVNFYRTTFSLNSTDLSNDTPIRLAITPSPITSNFRVQIYINGWQVGKYINNIGPQTIFVLPSGLLRRFSANTLAISLWSLDASGASIGALDLISDGIFRSSLSFGDYTDAPDYKEQEGARPKPLYFKPISR